MGALFNYLKQTQRLLHDPKQIYIEPGDLIDYVNTARGQIAGESASIRVIGTVATVIGQRPYNFSALNIGTPATTGIQGVINVRRVAYGIGAGQIWITPRPWEWFELYSLNNAIPANAAPAAWAQYAQGSAGTNTGSASSGSFYLDPPPDAAYTLYCDCVCYPIALTNDTTVEALPYLWTDAVPFFAAYYALLSMQLAGQQPSQSADKMYQACQTFVERVRRASNPAPNRWIYQQAADPVAPSKLAKPVG